MTSTPITMMLLFLSMIAEAAPALSQSRQHDDSTDILVIGKNHGQSTTIKQTRAIANSQSGQLARFEIPVCPLVIGLPEPHADIVRERVRKIALEAKIEVGKIGCQPNLTIVVTDDGSGFVNGLHLKRPILFDGLELHDLKRLLQFKGPSWTWQSVAARRRDGGPVEKIQTIQFGNGPPQAVSKGAYIVHGADLSRLSMPVRQDTESAFVVIDIKAIVGHTLQQVADYAAMVGLAAIRTEKADMLTERSILTIFDDAASGRTAQSQATPFDLAYLTSLYSGQSGYSSEQKLQAMAVQIDRSTKP